MMGVAVDASVPINFLIVAKVGLLASLPGFRFVGPAEVVAEVARPAQARALAREFEMGSVRKLGDMTPGELKMLVRLNERFGSGESACLAVAKARHWLLACDERGAFRRETPRVLGAGWLLDTPSLLILAIRKRLIGIDEAHRVKTQLEGRVANAVRLVRRPSRSEIVASWERTTAATRQRRSRVP